MLLLGIKFDLYLMDIYNMCLVLCCNKEKYGFCSICYFLELGELIEIVFELWNLEIICYCFIYIGNFF